MSPAELTTRLRAAGLIGGGDVRLVPLRGGVSSDIHLVEDGARRFVVKAALAQLRVRDDWFADVARNGVEQAYLAYAERVVPEAVPRVLAGSPEAGWFAMEFLGGEFSNWKELLLKGEAAPAHAQRAGEMLGRLHRASWDDPAARREFNTLGNFRALRLEPYLLTTAERVPAAADVLRAEARRLAATQDALVHGDFSPKNMLISPDRLVLLDAEVGWFGDPVFDPAFLLNHLHLKALVHQERPAPLLALVPAFWSAYGARLGPHLDSAFEARTVNLVLCLMLARVHGKSPAEYLDASQREFVTGFVLRHLPRPPARLDELSAAWHDDLIRP